MSLSGSWLELSPNPIAKDMWTWVPRVQGGEILRYWGKNTFCFFSKGGHFAALEQPDLLVNDIRKFSKEL